MEKIPLIIHIITDQLTKTNQISITVSLVDIWSHHSKLSLSDPTELVSRLVSEYKYAPNDSQSMTIKYEERFSIYSFPDPICP